MPSRRRPPRDAANAQADASRANRQPPGGRRRGKFDVEQRVQFVANLMLLGTPRAGILAALAEEARDGHPELLMPPRTLDDYIHRVRVAWEEEARAEMPTRRARQLRRLYAHIRTMLNRGRFNDLANMERLVAQIEGNLAPMKIETGPPKRGWDSLSDDELEEFRKSGRLPEGVSAEDLDKPN